MRSAPDTEAATHDPTPWVAPAAPATPFAARLFAVCWAFALIVHHHFGHGTLEALQVAEIFAAVLVMSFPGSWRLLAVLAATQIVTYLSRLPVASNHYTVMLFGNIALLIASWTAWRTHPEPERGEAIYRQARAAMPWLLIVLYFWGTIHKLNTAYLNPEVSCGAELMSRLELAVGLEPAPLSAWLAILATFLCEGGALFLLATRWGWAPAVVFILPFHLAIGATGFAYYVDFSALMLAMFVPLFDDERLAPLRRLWLGLEPALGKLSRARRALPALVLALIYLTVASSTSTMRFWPELLIAGALGCLLYAGLAACAIHAFKQRRLSGPRPLGRLSIGLSAVVAVFFLNGASPYLGLKTESSIAMYSNLRTEGSSNHLFVPASWQLTNLQTPVRIHRTNIKSLKRYRRGELGVTWFELWRAVKQSPNGSVRYSVDETELLHDGGRGDRAPYTPSWLFEKLWRFKPVSFRTPQPCTH
ncbi:MAG TPA: hypothetical protein VI197_03060 [Polyangiaceae bacterium]